MRWKPTTDGRYEIPVTTRAWKVGWFVAGLIFGIFAPICAGIWYRLRMPVFRSVRQLAGKLSMAGAFVKVVLMYAANLK